MRLLCTLFLISSFSLFAEDRCSDFYNQRGESAQKTQMGIDCYKEELKQAANNLEKAHYLNQLSYLHFFNAHWYLKVKLPELSKAIETAKASAQLFGTLYDTKSYQNLDPTSQALLAKGLYLHGTAVARYVDLKGKFEAIKRMGDIKKSMTSIIRIGQAPVDFYGAHRTLAIFHMKVPAIAGGKKKLAAKYFKLLIEKSEYRNGLSYYPINNLMYADYFFSESKNRQGCDQLALLKDLKSEDIEVLANGYSFETKQDVTQAKKLYSGKKCSDLVL